MLILVSHDQLQRHSGAVALVEHPVRQLATKIRPLVRINARQFLAASESADLQRSPEQRKCRWLAPAPVEHKEITGVWIALQRLARTWRARPFMQRRMSVWPVANPHAHTRGNGNHGRGIPCITAVTRSGSAAPVIRSRAQKPPHARRPSAQGYAFLAAPMRALLVQAPSAWQLH
jgi:hypothetical protein